MIPPISHFRTVFQTTPEMKEEFVNFLKTIFYRLDDRKVLAAMAKILDDPNKTDEMVYNELITGMDQMQKCLGPVRQIHSLSVLQRGMGTQAATLTTQFDKSRFHDYLEIYFRRYCNTIRKTAKMPLDGKIYAASDRPPQSTLKEKLESQSLLSRYPYNHVPLNDETCSNPELEPEKTHKPLGDEVPDASIDLISCLGGIHHIPQDRLEPFVDSMHKKLRPGGVLLLRDHDVTDRRMHAIVSMVHTFVNAADKTPWAQESKEVREFHSLEYWTKFLQGRNFIRVSNQALVLKDDPTKNAMMAFVRAPGNLEELGQAARYRSDGARPKDGTKATWIEWGNVRFSKQYAEFIQKHHSYAFDYIGHLRQHWRHAYEYLKESTRDNSFKLVSDNTAMNLFILCSATVQCALGYTMTLPSRLFARVHSTTHLTALEKAKASIEREYSNYIDHTPFYMFPWLSKCKTIWRAVYHSKESAFTKVTSYLGAAVTSVSLLVSEAVSRPIRALYTSGGEYVEPDKVAILVKDRTGEISQKDVIYQTPCQHKFALIPRYRPFTTFCTALADSNLELLEVGGQTELSVDVLLDEDQPTPQVDHARVIYELDKLQDEKRRRYVTYMVSVTALKAFIQRIGKERIEYVHE